MLHLRRFAEREGHARVPLGHIEDGFRLGIWVQSVRAKRPHLDPERRAALEAMPEWIWRPRDAAWQRGFAALERFVAQHGDARVPVNHKEDGYALGQWVARQRYAAEKGTLSSERRERLEQLPGWGLGRPT